MNPQNREETGKFTPGNNANPGGRPRIPDDLKKKAKDLCPKVLQTWEDIMVSGSKDSDRIRASENIYFLAYGKFVQPVEAEIKAEVNVVSIGVPDFALSAATTEQEGPGSEQDEN